KIIVNDYGTKCSASESDDEDKNEEKIEDKNEEKIEEKIEEIEIKKDDEKQIDAKYKNKDILYRTKESRQLVRDCGINIKDNFYWSDFYDKWYANMVAGKDYSEFFLDLTRVYAYIG